MKHFAAKRIVAGCLIAVTMTLYGCFSLGVSDEDAYAAHFEKVVLLTEALESKTYHMKDFLGEDDCREVFPIANYRYLALLAKRSFAFTEFVIFLKGTATRTLTWEFFVTTELPRKSEAEDADEHGEIGTPSPDSMLFSSAFMVENSVWRDYYVEQSAIRVAAGEYLLIRIAENNNFIESEESFIPDRGDDAAFCADKILLYMQSEG